MVNGRPVITGAAHALPRTSSQQDLWDTFFVDHFNDNALARRLFQSVGVKFRHAVATPPLEDVSNWSTQARMERYASESIVLANQAVSAALNEAGLAADQVGLFAVASCTGYVTPGLDTLVARDVGMATNIQRLFVGHMGCYAALPGLSTVADFVSTHQKPAVLLCIELASLHVQPSTNDVEQMVAHSLFSDAASAIVIQPSGPALRPGLELLETVAITDAAEADLMTWKITDKGFRMTLSAKVPDVLARHVEPLITGLLEGHGLNLSDIAGWAAHPGGPRILDVISEQLQLKPDDLAESRSVLENNGNCSSATVLLVLDEVRTNRITEAGQYVVSLAFGPGLTLYANLLRST